MLFRRLVVALTRAADQSSIRYGTWLQIVGSGGIHDPDLHLQKLVACNFSSKTGLFHIDSRHLLRSKCELAPDLAVRSYSSQAPVKRRFGVVSKEESQGIWRKESREGVGRTEGRYGVRSKEVSFGLRKNDDTKMEESAGLRNNEETKKQESSGLKSEEERHGLEREGHEGQLGLRSGKDSSQSGEKDEKRGLQMGEESLGVGTRVESNSAGRDADSDGSRTRVESNGAGRDADVDGLRTRVESNRTPRDAGRDGLRTRVESNGAGRDADRDSSDSQSPSEYAAKAQRSRGLPDEQRRGLMLGSVLKRLPVDADLQLELSKLGFLREDFTPMEVSNALRNLSQDHVGRKTIPDWERGLLLVTWWLEPHWLVSPFEHSVLNPLWEMLGEAGRIEQISQLYKKALKVRGVQFGAQISSNVIRALFTAGDYQGVLDILEDSLENGWMVRQYDEIIQSQMKLGLVDEAISTFGRAAAKGGDAPVRTPTYLAMLGGGVEPEQLQTGKNQCTLAVALGEMGRKDEAIAILKETMLTMRKGLYFPIFLWLDMVIAAIEMGCMKEAEEFRARGEASLGFNLIPALSFYVKKRHALGSHRAFLALLKFQPDLDVKGIGPALISVLCLGAHADEAVQILDALIKQGSTPYTKTFGKIIFLLLDQGRWPEAEIVLASYYQHIDAQPDPALSTSVFDSFVRRYCRAKKTEKVIRLVKQARAHKQAIPLSALYKWVQDVGRVSTQHGKELESYIREATKRTRLS